MKKFLKIIDIYGEEIKLTLDSKEKINTICGGILTIVTLFGLILFSWFIGNDIYYKSNPLSYLDLVIEENFPKINLTKTYFPIAFGLTDIDNYPIFNSSLLDVKLYERNYVMNKTSNLLELLYDRDIEFEKCTIEHFPSISIQEFNSASLNGFFCIKPSVIYVEGYWTQDILSYLSFRVSKCNYDLYPNFCVEKNRIDDYISANSVNFNILTIESILSVGNYEKPIKPTVYISYKFLHSQSQKITNYLIQNNYLITDNGFFSNACEETKFPKIVELQTDLLKIDEKSKEMIQMNIYSSNKSEKYFRKYIKISDILASVGGLMKVFITLFYFLMKPFNLLRKFKVLYKHIKSDHICKNFIDCVHPSFFNNSNKKNFSKKINNENNLKKNGPNRDKKNIEKEMERNIQREEQVTFNNFLNKANNPKANHKDFDCKENNNFINKKNSEYIANVDLKNTRNKDNPYFYNNNFLKQSFSCTDNNICTQVPFINFCGMKKINNDNNKYHQYIKNYNKINNIDCDKNFTYFQRSHKLVSLPILRNKDRSKIYDDVSGVFDQGNSINMIKSEQIFNNYSQGQSLKNILGQDKIYSEKIFQMDHNSDFFSYNNISLVNNYDSMLIKEKNTNDILNEQKAKIQIANDVLETRPTIDFFKITSYEMILGFLQFYFCKKNDGEARKYKSLSIKNKKIMTLLDCTSLMKKLIEIEYLKSHKNLENN